MYSYILCFCGRPIGQLYRAFVILRAMANEKLYASASTGGSHQPHPEFIGPADFNVSVGDILDKLGLHHQCCRGRMMSFVEIQHVMVNGV